MMRSPISPPDVPSERVTDRRTARLGEDRIGTLLWSFSLPAIAGTVVSSLYVVIDRAFLGNVVGADAIAGVSLCMPVSFVIMAFGMLLGVGSGALVSIRLGEQRREEAEVILGNTVALIAVVSFVLSAAFLAALDPLLVVFGASAGTLPYARQFLRVILFGSFFQYASFGLNSVIRAEGNPRLAMLTVMINAVVNILLDALLVWGLDLGVTGAAVATVIAQAVSACWTLLHFRSARSVLRLSARNLRLRWSVVRGVIVIGLAPFAMQLGASVVTLIINRGLVRYGGDVAVSAYGVIGALTMFMLMPVIGLTQGAQPIIGYNYGARRIDRVRQALRLTVIAATIVVSVGFVAAEVFPRALIRAFAHDQALVVVGARGMRICLLMAPVIGFQIVSSHFFQAIGRAGSALVLTLLRQIFVLIPLLLVLPRHLGLDGVWGAGPIADLVSTLITALLLVRQLRRLESEAAAPPGESA
jgi:putative MATE family efflux protein